MEYGSVEYKKYHSEKMRRIRKEMRWYQTYNNILRRCRQKGCDSSERYANVICEVTPTQLKEIWFRDKAFEMKKPVIHRIVNELGYVKDNLKYMEEKDHARFHFYENLKIKKGQKK